jgi:hypothetical protein
MIDTVILRIHGIQKYSQLIKCIELYNNNGYHTETARVPKKEIGELRKQGVKSDSELIDILQDKRTGDFLIKTQVGKQMNSSNHYAFTYFINYTKDHIEFSFSIPKYLHGTNIIMFTEHLMDRDFKFYENCILDYNFDRSFKLFSTFIRNFFHQEFTLCDVNLTDVEVYRIDVCFNQLFKSKKEALLYLDYQKRLKKKYARDEEGTMREYATSMMYTTKRYSAKIYHKGSEYEKNDMKEHEKINKERGYNYFDTKKLQNFSDKILRYELTIRNAHLNYLHKQYIFRKKCDEWQELFGIYTRVESARQKNDRIAKKIGQLIEPEKSKYRFEHPYEKILKYDRQVHKSVSKIITRRRYFMLDVSFDSAGFNNFTIDGNIDTVLFSKSLLRFCYEKLSEFMHEFQIKELPDIEIIKRRIDDWNKSHAQQLPKMEMVHFYEHLIKYGSFKECIKYAGYSRATGYRYLQRFKKIQITDQSLTPIDTENEIPTAKLDLNDYHSALTYDNIHKIKIFDY